MDPFLPLFGHFADDDHSGSRVFAALGVVGRRSKHRPWYFRQSRPVFFVKSLQADPELLRGSSHFIECGEAVEDIERGIFQTFGHHGAGALLKFQNEFQLQPASLTVGIVEFFKEKNIPQEIENGGVDGDVAPFGRAQGAKDDLPIGL